MARSQKVPSIAGSHLDDKFRQSAAKIAGRGRRAIHTDGGISTVFDGTTQTIFSKTFKAKFFKSLGDSIFITLQGNLDVPVGKIGSFQVRVSEDSGAIDPVDYIISLPLIGGSVSIDFTAFATLVLLDGNLIQGNGVTLAQNAAATVRNRRLPGPYTYNTSQFTIKGIAIGDATCTIKIDLFQIEFVPAAVK